MDIKSPAERSKNMAAIRSRNTKPEIKLRSALFREGYRFRVNYKIEGKPDLVFVKKKIAVFVDGCFWHACPVCYREPEQNKEFWRNKIQANKNRDIEVNKILSEAGWIVLRFWEHEIKKDFEKVKNVIKKSLA